MTPEADIVEALFRIPTKEGVDVDFILNSAQRKLDENLTGRDLVPKARQEGVSSYYLARYTAACMMYRNVRAVVISHDIESTQRMLGRVQYFIHNIKGPKPKIKNMSKNEITFPKMDSMFYLGTAGAKQFGRGDTITHLHCSEFAFWPNAKRLMTGLLQAVPETGEIGIESTGNGLNDYYQRCMRAAKGQSRWTSHFLPWHTFEEYTVKTTPEDDERIMGSLDEDLGELELVGHLTPGQILWRRRKLEDLNYDMSDFMQEYPMTLSECFQATGESIFYKTNYQPCDEWKRVERNTWILDGHPDPLKHYILGVDVAGGVGLDSSVVEILCMEDMEQVGEYVDNKIAPDRLAGRVLSLGKMFNEAYLVVEQNNHGLVTVSYIRDAMNRGEYAHIKLYRMPTTTKTQPLLSMGIKTTARTKPLMIGNLRKLLADDIIYHSDVLHTELSTFVEKETGALEAEDGCHDDTVIALACAAMGINKAGLFLPREAPPPRNTYKDPLLFDNILEDLRGRGQSFPISPQHRAER